MKDYTKQHCYQVEYWTINYRGVHCYHECRVFANDELDAECTVADQHPDGIGFHAQEPHGSWYGNY